MFDIAIRISRSMSILLWHFDLITTTAEKPVSHKYDVANGTTTSRALQPTSGNSARALVPPKMSELGLYMLFEVRSEVRSINCSASRNLLFIYAYELMLCLHVFRQTGPPRRVDCLAPPSVCHIKTEASR